MSVEPAIEIIMFACDALLQINNSRGIEIKRKQIFVVHVHYHTYIHILISSEQSFVEMNVVDKQPYSIVYSYKQI